MRTDDIARWMRGFDFEAASVSSPATAKRKRLPSPSPSPQCSKKRRLSSLSTVKSDPGHTLCVTGAAPRAGEPFCRPRPLRRSASTGSIQLRHNQDAFKPQNLHGFQSRSMDEQWPFVQPTPPSSRRPWGRGRASSRASTVRASSPSRDSKSGRSTGRASGAKVDDRTYRDLVLTPNRVFIHDWGTDIPTGLYRTTQDILLRPRQSPEPEEPAAQASAYSIAKAANRTESAVSQECVKCFFPKDVSGRSLSAEVQPLSKHAAIPQGRPEEKDLIPNQVSLPKPDIIYGYTRGEEKSMLVQQNTVQGIDLTYICMPVSNLYRPYFVVEIKPNDGTPLGVQNQAAGSGSACANAAAILHSLAELPMENTQSYSCTLVGTSAMLWIHWTDLQSCTHHMSPLHSYDLLHPQHFLRFRKAVRNIIDWGLNERYATQQECLDVLYAKLLQSTALKRKRAESNPGIPSEPQVSGVSGS